MSEAGPESVERVDVFSFEKEVSSGAIKIIVPYYLILCFLGVIIVVNNLISSNYMNATYWIVSLIFTGIFGYVFYRYRIPVSLEVTGQNLYANNTCGKHLKIFSLCELDVSSLIPIKEPYLREYLEQNKGFFILFKIKGEKGIKTEIGSAILRPGYIPMKKLIAFQRWLIDHIKENCPEEVYKEALTHKIDYPQYANNRGE